MSPVADMILKRLLDSGESESRYVAEALLEIASNGEGAEADDSLITSAHEIIAAAQAFIAAVDNAPIVAKTDLF